MAAAVIYRFAAESCNVILYGGAQVFDMLMDVLREYTVLGSRRIVRIRDGIDQLVKVLPGAHGKIIAKTSLNGIRQHSHRRFETQPLHESGQTRSDRR